MAQVYLFADPHFGHENMAKKRGFESSLDHDAHIVAKWNMKVRKNDKIFLLGDVTMEEKKSYNILGLLNGNITVVMGNHDEPRHVTELLKYVKHVAGAISYKGYLLTHVPVHENEMNPETFGRFKGNIHGHVHENEIYDDRYVCVSFEVVGEPILFTDIDEIF